MARRFCGSIDKDSSNDNFIMYNTSNSGNCSISDGNRSICASVNNTESISE